MCEKHLALLQVKYSIIVLIACNGQTYWIKSHENSKNLKYQSVNYLEKVPIFLIIVLFF